MTEKTSWESVKAEGSAALDKLKEIVHEGNVRRVRVRQGERTIAEFPLTAGVVGAVLAPALAAIGALVALALVPFAPAGIPVLAASVGALLGLTQRARAEALEARA